LRIPQQIYQRIDNTYYNRAGGTWWQPDSVLHLMETSVNPVRIGYAREKLLGDLRISPKDKNALEVGCGGGVLAEEIARMGFATFGIDPSKESLHAAINHSLLGGLNISYAAGAGEALPYQDKFYDVVLCCDVLEHVRDLPKVISEISRVLKPGGIFFYDTLNRTLISKFVVIKVAQEWKRWAFMPSNIHVWEMFIKPGELKLLLAQNNLEWKEHRGIKPDASVFKILQYLRKRAKGELTYKDMSNKLPLIQSNDMSIMYMGYAVKRQQHS
jgi:2-polyprenyl-6-hydroxyphenyl methylase/3-demethylubiquinone-9 3-methyltransferase